MYDGYCKKNGLNKFQRSYFVMQDPWLLLQCGLKSTVFWVISWN